MSVKLAKLVKEARTNAGLTQQALADMVTGLSASDISKTERNEKEPTVEQLKAIAKATGVTQKSLVEAASAKTRAAAEKPASTAKSSGTAKTSSTAKTSGAAKTSSTAKTAAKQSTAKTSGTAKADFELTAAEKKLVELYRKADSETKKNALKVLKGEESNDLLTAILGNLLK